MLKLDYDGTYCVDVKELLESLYSHDCEDLQLKATEILKRDGVTPLNTEHYSDNQIDMTIAHYLPEGRDLYDEIAFFLARYASESMENAIYKKEALHND